MAASKSKRKKSGGLKAILFDVDDTLFSTTSLATKARKNAIQAMIDHGLKGKLEDLYKELCEVIQEFSTNYGNHFDQLLRRLPASYFPGINRAILISAAVVAYHETKSKELKVYDDALEFLTLLKKKTKLTTGVITSGLVVKQAEKIVRLGIYPLLSPKAIFISEQIGINKPNWKVYLKVCDSLKLPPKEIMYVGDNPTNDITPPHQIGMVTCWNHRSGKFRLSKKGPQPDYKIRNFHELVDILNDDFGMAL